MSVDIMLDLETTGLAAGCAVLSIGLTSLDEKHQCYVRIIHQSCLEAGLKDSYGTMAWWGKQTAAARMEAFTGDKSLIEALGIVTDWYKMVERIEGEAFIWGNGADFDLPILKAAYEAVGMKEPWKPYNGRCYRTFKNLPENKGILTDTFEGLKHNALADAVHQARHMMKILRNKKQKEMFPEGWEKVSNSLS